MSGPSPKRLFQIVEKAPDEPLTSDDLKYLSWLFEYHFRSHWIFTKELQVHPEWPKFLALLDKLEALSRHAYAHDPR